MEGTSNAALEAELHSTHRVVTSAQRRLLALVAECERRELWDDGGHRDLCHWLTVRLGISAFAARRWIAAARVLPDLPHLSRALEEGALSIEKTVELCRFATPATERKLITWARRVTLGGVRSRADEAVRPTEAAGEIERRRYLSYWYFDEGRSLALQGVLPAAEGAIVANALDRLVDRLPEIVDDETDELVHDDPVDVRRADALVAVCSRELAEDQDPDRPRVVVHVDAVVLASDAAGAGLELGGVLHPEAARRLACDCLLEVTPHDPQGRILGSGGSSSRTVPRGLKRRLRYRDRGCTFPGCPSRRFLHAHHIVHWVKGGPTELENLVLLCHLHHKLVHEHGWGVWLDAEQNPVWCRPNGIRYELRAPPLPVAI